MQLNSKLSQKLNVGIDLVYMKRYVDKINNQRFLDKILSKNEQAEMALLRTDKRKLEYLCGRYASKEAYAKAMKTGIGQVDFLDFEVLKDKNGVCYSTLEDVDVSISHDGDYAIAVVVIGGELVEKN